MWAAADSPSEGKMWAYWGVLNEAFREERVINYPSTSKKHSVTAELSPPVWPLPLLCLVDWPAAVSTEGHLLCDSPSLCAQGSFVLQWWRDWHFQTVWMPSFLYGSHYGLKHFKDICPEKRTFKSRSSMGSRIHCYIKYFIQCSNFKIVNLFGLSITWQYLCSILHF